MSVYRIQPPTRRRRQRAWTCQVDPDDSVETVLTVTRLFDRQTWTYRCDPGQADRLSGFSWLRDRGGYAATNAIVEGKGRIVSLHHVVTDAPPTPNRAGVLDHVNGNIADNHRENLQFTTHRRNAMKRHDSVGGLYQHASSIQVQVEPRSNGRPSIPGTDLLSRALAHELRAIIVEMVENGTDSYGARFRARDELVETVRDAWA